MNRLLPGMPRQAVIRASLEGRGALVLTRSMEEACEISNRIAPEHLEVSAREPRRWEPLLRHAGAIFLGAYTSESLGDYCAGPNHVLPTSGTARSFTRLVSTPRTAAFGLRSSRRSMGVRGWRGDVRRRCAEGGLQERSSRRPLPRRWERGDGWMDSCRNRWLLRRGRSTPGVHRAQRSHP